jgi:4-hydroxybenzoate polyprenyltransferase
VFIALCAVLMVHQTNHLLPLAYNSQSLLFFVFFSTLCSYNLHWWLTPFSSSEKIRSHWTQQHRITHLILITIGAAGSFWFFLPYIDHWIWIAPAAILTFLYSAPKLPFQIFRHLKKVAIGKTIFLSFVWMYVTTALPIFVSGKAWQEKELLFCCSRFFLIYAIGILFYYRDREQDKQEGIRSMITYFSPNGVNYLFLISLLLFAVSTILLKYCGVSALVIVILLIPGLFTALLYRTAKNNHSDYLYYFILDGLMMFSSLITVFLSF